MGKTRSRRASLRHPGHDYTTPGGYFVTVCTQDREHLFGIVSDGVTVPNLAGDMVTAVWHQLPEIFPGVVLDAFQLMPDHIHGIIFLGTEPDSPAQHLLGKIVQNFKGRTTTWYCAAARARLVPCVDERLWQRGYHDRIIRTDRELDTIRTYIAGNPSR